jgi:glycosyltransferase involved in cell wall biosynthesis
VDGLVLLRARNAANLLSLCEADAGMAPTQWQRNQFPPEVRQKIQVIHNGIDTQIVRPNPKAKFVVPTTNRSLKAGDEVISFVARNLEPSRGYHVFMRALPSILSARPKAQVVIVGGDAVSHGPVAPAGLSWRRLFLDEVKDRIDPDRIFFIRSLPYADYLTLLQVSRVHVYLTYPSALSSSLLEAMAVECMVIASDTAPVNEIITHEKNGHLVPFFDHEALARAVIDASDKNRKHSHLRRHARQTVIEKHDLQSVILPKQLELIGVTREEAAHGNKGVLGRVTVRRAAEAGNKRARRPSQP